MKRGDSAIIKFFDILCILDGNMLTAFFIEIVTKIDVVMIMFEFVIDELSLNFEYSFLHS